MGRGGVLGNGCSNWSRVERILHIICNVLFIWRYNNIYGTGWAIRSRSPDEISVTARAGRSLIIDNRGQEAGWHTSS